MKYAGLDRRIGAYFIDIILLYAVLAALQFGLSAATGGFPFNRLDTGPALEAWVLLTFSLPTWVYFTSLEASSRQATLGKRLFKIRVADLAGIRITRGRAFFRTLLKLVPWELTHITLLLPTPIFSDPSRSPALGLIAVYATLILYMATMIFTPRKRSLHDILAGTLVLADEV